MTLPIFRRALSRYAAAAAVLAAVTLAAGCSDNPEAAAPATTPSTTTASATAVPPPPAPPAHACYDLAFRDVLEPTNDATPVPCTSPHTTQTVQVGRIDPVVDGHLLAVDSARVQQRIADSCRGQVAAHLGGSQAARRLSRFEAVWFSPTLDQSDAGALWFRCDLTLVSRPETLGRLPARTRGVLGRPGALDTYGTCGTTSPAAPGFRRVACSQPHKWRARAALDLPPRAKYLGKAANSAADARCRAIETGLAGDSLKLRWSFEWPTRAQWNAGQRYGLCWTPDPA